MTIRRSFIFACASLIVTFFASVNPATASRAQVTLTLGYRNEAQLEALVEAQADPRSPLYHHWLTNEQFNSFFAPSQTTYTNVIASLQRRGFRVVRRFANRTVVDAEWLGSGPVSIPPELRGLLIGVDDLTTRAARSIRWDPHAAQKARPMTPVGPPLYGPPGASGFLGWGPLAFSRAYDLPVQHRRPGGGTYDGTGRAIAEVTDGDFLDSDLTAFLNYFGRTRSGKLTTREFIDGGPPLGLSANSLLTTADVETILSNAPGATLYAYEIPSLSNDRYITDAYNQIVSENRVDVVNSGFGVCEQTAVTSARTWDRIALQGVAKGITFVAEAGETALSCNPLGVVAPASSPHFLAVGGLQLTVDANGNWVSEFGDSLSGGGYSVIFPRPRWQRGVHNMQISGRNLPDISFFNVGPCTTGSDPGCTGGAVYINGTWDNQYNPAYGAPFSSAIYDAAQIEEDEVVNGRMGLVGATIFDFFKTHGYGSSPLYFHDAIYGYNGFYGAQIGYDNVSGIGSMDVWNFIEELNKK